MPDNIVERAVVSLLLTTLNGTDQAAILLGRGSRFRISVQDSEFMGPVAAKVTLHE